MPYVSFSCLPALTRNSGTTLNRLSSRHPCLLFFNWCIGDLKCCVSGVDILVLFLMLVGRLLSLLPLSVKLAASFLDALYQVSWGSSCVFLVRWMFLFWNSVGFFRSNAFSDICCFKNDSYFVFLFSICRNWLAHQMCGGCRCKQGYSQSCKYQPFQRWCPVS